jgi:hypothetical protein
MVPKPRHLDQGEIEIESSFGSTETSAAGYPRHSGVFQQENLEPSQRDLHDENLQPPQAKNSGLIRPVVHVPKHTNSWFVRKQQRDPGDQLMARPSFPGSSLVSASFEPPETSQTKLSDAGIMSREGDFLDRTFDNVENVTCHRTSISPTPPAPIFSCSSNDNGHLQESVVAFDVAALSSAKQQGYNIEQFDQNDDEDHEMQTSTPGHPPLLPVNSTLEETTSNVGAPAWANTERAVAVPKKDMLDYIFENFHSVMCREDRSLPNRIEDSKPAALPQLPPLHQRNKKEQGALDEKADNEEPSPLNLHQTLSDSESENMMSGCNSIFTDGGASSTGVSTDISSRNPSVRRGAFLPIRYEGDIPSTQGSKLRTGMMLLADGSVVVPEEFSNTWIQRQKRRASPYSSDWMYQSYSNSQQTQSNSSLQLSRENSLLDMFSRSGEASEEESRRIASLQHQKLARTNGGREKFIVPRQAFDGENVKGVQIKMSSPSSAEDIDRQHFWKQVAFTAMVLLLACGLIVVAMAFFWPANKMA